MRASIETIEDGPGGFPQELQRPVYAAPSLMSVRSCFVVSSSNGRGEYSSNGQSQLPYHYAQSQPQLSHSFSQPFINRMMSNSADHLVTSSLSQLALDQALDSNPNLNPVGVQQGHVMQENGSVLPFHEHVRNSAAHKLYQNQKKSVTVDSVSSDVNVIGQGVRIQVCCFQCFLFINCFDFVIECTKIE